jgi:hypothetical protein
MLPFYFEVKIKVREFREWTLIFIPLFNWRGFA